MSGLSSSSTVVWLIGTAIAVFPGQAEEFSWQLSGVTSRTEIGDFHTDSWAVDGTYYVNPLDDGAGPYALASFLNPTTRVSAAASRIDSDFFDHPSAYTLDGAYVLPGERWYVGANYAKSDPGNQGPDVTRNDTKGYGVLAGRYLGADTTLELGLGRSEHNWRGDLPAGRTLLCRLGHHSVRHRDDYGLVSLDVFHVRRFRSLTYFRCRAACRRAKRDRCLSPDLAGPRVARRRWLRARIFSRGRAVPDEPAWRARRLLGVSPRYRVGLGRVRCYRDVVHQAAYCTAVLAVAHELGRYSERFRRCRYCGGAVHRPAVDARSSPKFSCVRPPPRGVMRTLRRLYWGRVL